MVFVILGVLQKMILTVFLTFSLLFVDLIGGQKKVAIIGGGLIERTNVFPNVIFVC